MSDSLEQVIFRPPATANAQAVLELMLSCDISEYGLPDSDMEDLIHEWDQIDLEQDAWLAFSTAHNLVGYAKVLPMGKDLRYLFYVHPEWPGKDLSQALLFRCHERGQAIAGERDYPLEAMARTFIPHANQRHIQVAEEAGFRPGKYIFNMRMQMDSMPAEPALPDGVVIRHAVSGQDDRAIHAVIESAFDRPGRDGRSFEDWAETMLRLELYDPELWFLAVVGDEIVGASLSFAYPDEGWVRQLAVAESWRRQGIGMALLQHTFRAFKERGFEAVGLAVEADNPRAYRLYESAGMACVRQYDEYLRALRTE